MLSTRLDASVLSRFAVFRRQALPSEDLSGSKPGGGELGRELSKLYELSAYYPVYVRRLYRPVGGRRYLVVPAYGRSEAVPPAHCFPAGVRRELVEEQHRRLVEPLDCLVEMGGAESAPAQGCEPFAAIDEGGRVFGSFTMPREPAIELVPDGVASVRIVYRESPAMTVSVSGNAFSFTPRAPASRIAAELSRLAPKITAKGIPKGQRRRIVSQWDKAVGEAEPTKLEWIDSAGRVVRAIGAPAAGRDSNSSVGDLRAPIEG